MIENLVAAGITRLVINHAWLGEQIESYLGDGHALGAHITWSPESPALETAGGLARALEHLGERFIAVNADILCDYPFARLLDRAASMEPHIDAHLVMVDNPPQHPAGDFSIDGGARLTFAGIGLYRARLLAGIEPGQPAPLAPLLREAMKHQAITGEHYRGLWSDIGTPERLAEADRAHARHARLPQNQASPTGLLTP
jgi:MurNAc alpha-1-phosphate uridylyltransferase